MHFGASVSGFAGCQRVVLDAPLSPVQSRPLTCAAGCQRVILDAPLSPVQSRPISRGRHVSLPARYHNIGCVKATWSDGRLLVLSSAEQTLFLATNVNYTTSPRATICKFQIYGKLTLYF